MDLATQQILSGLTAGESRDSEGGAGGLTNFGNKVKEYWNTVKTEPLAQVRPPHLSCFFAHYRARLVLAEKVFETYHLPPPQPSLSQAGYGNSDEIRELMAEKDSLDSAFKHAARLLEQGVWCDLCEGVCCATCVRVWRA